VNHGFELVGPKALEHLDRFHLHGVKVSVELPQKVLVTVKFNRIIVFPVMTEDFVQSCRPHIDIGFTEGHLNILSGTEKGYTGQGQN
jgi:hypothetical protein